MRMRNRSNVSYEKSLSNYLRSLYTPCRNLSIQKRKFFKENSYLSNYGTNSSGWTLAKYVLKRAIQEKNIKVLIRWFPDMAARFIGMKAGKL